MYLNVNIVLVWLLHIKELINNIIDNISVFNDIIFEDCAVGVAMNMVYIQKT
jgi:hypothetical protein